MIGLVDGNNFFVSCERVFDPSLEGKPVAVLSNNDGCCISRSNEFKALHIPMGTPFFQLKPIIAKYGLILKSSNYELYGDLSRRMISILCDFVPRVEQYSIDEAFIYPELKDDTDWYAFGKQIRRTVLKWIGIPCGVGFAKTKTLAKIANHIGKKSSTGVYVMPDDVIPILQRIPVEDVWGVGRALVPKLQRLGIQSAADLAQQDVGRIRKRFNIILARTVAELQGIQCIDEETEDVLSKSISCSRSFGSPVTDLRSLTESVANYTARASVKLRQEGQVASGVNVYFQMYPEYSPIPMEARSTSMTIVFSRPTDATGEMLTDILPKLERIYVPGRRYKKSGVCFFGLESISQSHPDLFRQNEGASPLYKIVDEINTKFGKDTLFHLAEGVKKDWKMKRDQLSPAYTTNWDQILTVR